MELSVFCSPMARVSLMKFPKCQHIICKVMHLDAACKPLKPVLPQAQGKAHMELSSFVAHAGSSLRLYRAKQAGCLGSLNRLIVSHGIMSTDKNLKSWCSVLQSPGV